MGGALSHTFPLKIAWPRGTFSEGSEFARPEAGKALTLHGNDNFVTNPVLLKQGCATALPTRRLVKMNQIGTLSETLEVIRIDQRAGLRTVVSARCGETEDDFMSDLAVATRSGVS